MRDGEPGTPSVGPPGTVAQSNPDERPPRGRAEEVLVILAVLGGAGLLAILAFWWFALDDSTSRRAMSALKDDPVEGFEPAGYRKSHEEHQRLKFSADINLDGDPSEPYARIEQEFAPSSGGNADATAAMQAVAEFARRHGYHVEPVAGDTEEPRDCMHQACGPKDQSRMRPEHGFTGMRGDGDTRTSLSIRPLGQGRIAVSIDWDAGPRYTSNDADDTALAAARKDPMADYVPSGGTSTPTYTGNQRSAASVIRAFDVPAGKGAVPSAIAAGRAAEREGWDVDWSDPVRWMPDGRKSYPARFLSGTKQVDGVTLRLEISGTQYENGRHRVDISVFGPDRPPEP